MSCCGQKRQQWLQETKKIPEPIKAEPVPQNPIQLYYSGKDHFFAKGSVTGILYLFAPGKEGVPVDYRDAPSILETYSLLLKEEKQH